MPNSKPDLVLDDDGICSACLNFEKRISVNWDDRKRDLENQFKG